MNSGIINPVNGLISGGVDNVVAPFFPINSAQKRHTNTGQAPIDSTSRDASNGDSCNEKFHSAETAEDEYCGTLPLANWEHVVVDGSIARQGIPVAPNLFAVSEQATCK